MLGGIGSGKSKSTEPLLEAFIRAGCPLLSSAVKPDESERYIRICEKLGCMDRLVLLRPDGKHRMNLLGQLLKPPYGSALDATNFLMNLSDAVNRSGGGGRENEGFWKAQETRGFDTAIRLATLGMESCTIADVWDIIRTSPQSLAHAQSPEFNPSIDSEDRGDFAAAYVAAHRTATGADRQSLNDIRSFYFNELPAVDKIRGSVLSSIGGTIGQLNTPPFLDALSSENPNFTIEDIANHNLICVVDYPLMAYGAPARVMQASAVMLAQRHLMRRDASKVKRPFIIVRDEAAWVLAPDWDSAAQNVLRSQKACSIAIIQDLDTGYAALGGSQKAQHELKAFVSNHMTKLLFANSSQTTNEWASALFGMTQRMELSSGGGSQPQGYMDSFLGVKSSVGWAMRFQPLVRPEEFTQLCVGTCYMHTRDGVSFLDLRTK